MDDSAAWLFDTNSIIEAVRTGCWPALTGGLAVETVAECVEECRRGDRLSSGYVKVSEEDLDRLARVHEVSVEELAALLLHEEAGALDQGERDLVAHALTRPDEPWRLCSPDRASVRIGVALGIGDRLTSLEDAARAVGARPKPPLREHFGSAWLARERTAALLRP